MMKHGDDYDDYLDEYEEPDMTIVRCECGKEWVKFVRNIRLISIDEWYEQLDNHFYGDHNEHDAKMMERNNNG